MKRKTAIILAIILIFSTMSVMLYSASAQTVPYDEYEYEVLKLVNKERINNNLHPLSMETGLQNVCDTRAVQIESNFSHSNPDGSSAYGVLVKNNNILNSSLGENIARGQANPEAVMNSWMNSTGHRANILNYQFSHIGVGFKSTANTWVQVFAGLCDITSVKVVGGDASYEQGTSPDDFTQYLEITCACHGTTIIPIISEMCSGYDSEKLGKQNITVTYNALRPANDNFLSKNGMYWRNSAAESVSAADTKYEKMTASFSVTVTPKQTVATTEPTTIKPSPSVSFDETIWEMLKIENENRIKSGLQPLSFALPLIDLSAERAKELEKSFTTISDLKERVTSGGMPISKVAEIILSGDYTAEQAAAATDSQYSSVLGGKRYVHTGIGHNASANTWSQIFLGACTVKSVSVVGGEGVYKIGTSPNEFTEYLAVNCEAHGTTYIPIIDSMCSGYNPNKTGEQTVTVTYNAVESSEDGKEQNGLLYITDDIVAYNPIKTTFKVEIYDGSAPTTAKPVETTAKPIETTAPTTAKPVETTEPTTAKPVETTAPTTAKPVETTEAQETQSDDITEPDFAKDGMIVCKPNTSVDVLSKNVFNYLPNISKLVVFDKDKKPIADENKNVGTGFSVEWDLRDNSTALYNVVVLCDITGDGKVSASDARAILRFSAGLDIPDKLSSIASDIDFDGKVTSRDARTTLRISAGLESVPEKIGVQ